LELVVSWRTMHQNQKNVLHGHAKEWLGDGDTVIKDHKVKIE
jgi:hypothetical protein